MGKQKENDLQMVGFPYVNQLEGKPCRSFMLLRSCCRETIGFLYRCSLMGWNSTAENNSIAFATSGDFHSYVS